MIARIEKLMKYDTAGDPITGLKWTRKTTEKISKELASIGITVSPNTAGKLLKKLGFSLKVNHKKIARGGKSISREDQQNRDEQFRYISELRESYAQKGHPSISVDTKKKELIGNFKNPGLTYRRKTFLILCSILMMLVLSERRVWLRGGASAGGTPAREAAMGKKRSVNSHTIEKGL